MPTQQDMLEALARSLPPQAVQGQPQGQPMPPQQAQQQPSWQQMFVHALTQMLALPDPQAQQQAQMAGQPQQPPQGPPPQQMAPQQLPQRMQAGPALQQYGQDMNAVLQELRRQSGGR